MSDSLADLRFGDLITFLTVHRCGAITGAARALKVTPSQVSKAVHRLERQLGATLLSRSTRGVIVSDAGRRLIPQLEEVAARLQQMRPDAAAREELALAAPSYLNAIFLPRIAAELDGVVVRGLELPPALVRAYAVENFFDVALVVGTEKLPGAWVGVGVGHVRKALFAAPEVAAQARRGAGRSQAHRRAAVRDADLQRQRAVRARRRRLPARPRAPPARPPVADAGRRARPGALDRPAHLRPGDRGRMRTWRAASSPRCACAAGT